MKQLKIWQIRKTNKFKMMNCGNKFKNKPKNRNINKIKNSKNNKSLS